MKPRDANTEKKLLSLKEDNFPRSNKKWAILVSERHISLFPPVVNGYAEEYITIPKKQFDAIIDWYNKNQTNKEQ